MVSLPMSDNQPPDGPESAEEHAGAVCGARRNSGPPCGDGLEKVYHTTAVRYGYMKLIGEFTRPPEMRFACGAAVVIQTHRGIEVGEQVSVSCTGCDKHVSREQIKTYIKNSGSESYHLENGRVLREATVDDLAEDMRLRQTTTGMKQFAQRRADELELKMKVVECEYLLGGDRAVFYFMADGRVDFRALVKNLSHEFQTRIKMHQVGARDEARLLADYETCGREVCCKVFLKTLRPVTMRMAKLQRATLDPSKVSGRCGRLKCCLRYEHESYESLESKLPRVGERVNTAHGYGTVVNRQILTQLVQIRPAENGTLQTVAVEDVLERTLKEFPPEVTASTQRESRRREREVDRKVAKNQARATPKPKSKVERSGPPSSPDEATEAARPASEPESPATESSAPASSRIRKRRRGRRRRTRPGGPRSEPDNRPGDGPKKD